MVEIGRIDIMMPVSLLSRFLANPREGHLEQVLHIFAYLKSHDRSAIVFDTTTPSSQGHFKECYWSHYYPEAADELLPNMPQKKGNSVNTTCFVDADHAGCQVTRRSHTGIFHAKSTNPMVL
jgi:hypothetical protein